MGVEPDHRSTALVRRAEHDDADEIARIWQLGWREAHLGHVPNELIAARTPESFNARAIENLEHTAVADLNDGVAGFVVWVDDEIELLYLDPESRRGWRRPTPVA